MKREFPGSATIVVIHASNLFITFLDWNRADLRCGSNVRESPDWFGPESRGWNCQHRLHRTRNLAAWKFPCQLHENGEKNANKILFFYFLEKISVLKNCHSEWRNNSWRQTVDKNLVIGDTFEKVGGRKVQAIDDKCKIALIVIAKIGKLLIWSDFKMWPTFSTTCRLYFQVELEGLTGQIKFDSLGFRSDFNLDIIELKKEGLVQVGTWNQGAGANFTRNYTESYSEIVESLHNKTLKITTILVSK